MSEVENTAKLPEVKNHPYAAKEMKFTFRKDEQGNKKPAIVLMVPVLTQHGLIEALQDTKQFDYVLELIESNIKDAAKLQINDSVKPVTSQKDFDAAKTSLKYLAYLPPSQRGDSIEQSVKDAFVKDYVSLMPSISNKTEDQVAAAATLLSRGIRSVKNNKKALVILQEQLALFVTSIEAGKLEEYSEFVELLSKRIEDYLAAEEVKPEDNL